MQMYISNHKSSSSPYLSLYDCNDDAGQKKTFFYVM